MSALEWTLVVAGAGLGSYLLRVSPFLWERLRRVGQRHFRFLTYVSLAIAAGIVSRSLVYAGGELTFGADFGIKVVAVAAALAAQRLTRNLPLALFAGVGIAAGLKALGG